MRNIPLTTLVLLATVGCDSQGRLMAAHEISAIGKIRSIHQAETQYYAQFGKYALSLTELGPPAGAPASPSRADLISKELADGKSDGYTFVVRAKPNGYTVNADPEQFNVTGRRSFYSDESLAIRANSTGVPATAASDEIK
jgi:hypothetical protein